MWWINVDPTGKKEIHRKNRPSRHLRNCAITLWYKSRLNALFRNSVSPVLKLSKIHDFLLGLKCSKMQQSYSFGWAAIEMEKQRLTTLMPLIKRLLLLLTFYYRALTLTSLHCMCPSLSEGWLIFFQFSQAHSIAKIFIIIRLKVNKIFV